MRQIKITVTTDFGYLLNDDNKIAKLIIDRILLNFKLNLFKYHINNEETIAEHILIKMLQNCFPINFICSSKNIPFKVIIQRNPKEEDRIILYSIHPTVLIEDIYIDVAYYLEKLLDVCEHIQILNIETEYINDD